MSLETSCVDKPSSPQESGSPEGSNPEGFSRVEVPVASEADAVEAAEAAARTAAEEAAMRAAESAALARLADESERVARIAARPHT